MRLIILLFRLPWYVYLGLAPLLLAGGIALFVNAKTEEAAKVQALHAPPPAAVSIEKFAAARDIGMAGEVNIVGQLDIARSMELIESKSGGRERHHWTLIPIYPAKAADSSGPAPGVLVQDGPVSEAQLAQMQTGQGAFGPVLKIDGVKTTEIDAVSANERVFRARGPDTANAILIDPFENGRSDGLKPSGDKRDGSIALAIFALLTAAYGLFQRWRNQRRIVAEQAYL